MYDISEYLWNHTGSIDSINESSDSPTSDNAIYYKIGMHKYLWAKHFKSRFEKLTRKYNISGDHKRAGIIAYAKDVCVPILKASEEVIPRDKWDLDGLIGETEYQLMHPHYWTLTEFCLSENKRLRDVLTVFECSNSKPYVDSKIRKNLFLDRYRAFTDCACISNPGIIPLECSQYYPYRYDEWDHFAEKPDIAKKYTWVCAARFLTYVKKMGYKHVVVVMQTPYTQEWAQMLYDKNIEGAQSWLHIVNTPEFDKKMIAKYKKEYNNHLGLMHMRILQVPEFSERYRRLLKGCLGADDKREFEKLEDILKIESRSEREQKLAEFNKEHDVQDYEPTKGFSGSFKLLDRDSSTTKSKVEGYESYVKKHLGGLEQAYKDAQEDDKKWHKHRVVFTVLDLLMDKDKDKLTSDPDSEYWNMYKAIHNLCDNNKDIKQLNTYCYCYAPLMQDISKESVQKYTNKLGITMFWDDRRRHPDR
jgi:hypothetical protein